MRCKLEVSFMFIDKAFKDSLNENLNIYILVL